MGPVMSGVRAFSLTMAGEYEEASRLMAGGTRHPNAHAHYHLVAMAAVCDALAGQDERARRHMMRVRHDRPGYGDGDFHRAFHFHQTAHVHRTGETLRRPKRLGKALGYE